MAYITLSSINGCISPASGETSEIYGVKYNLEKIISYYKKDISPNVNNSFNLQPIVVIVFENYTQNYIFDTSTNRDDFYSSLP